MYDEFKYNMNSRPEDKILNTVDSFNLALVKKFMDKGNFDHGFTNFCIQTF